MHISVLSFNIRYAGEHDKGPAHWSVRKDAVVACIRHYDPDVVCLQEALVEQFQQILWFLNELDQQERWCGIFAGRNDGGQDGEATAIVFQKEALVCSQTRTFWLSETPDVPGSVSSSWGNRIPRICTEATFIDTRRNSVTGGQQLLVFNTHLDHKSAEARQRGLALIMSRVPDGLHAVLCGDFNASPVERTTLDVVHARMDDVAVLYGGAARCSTFHGFSGSASAGEGRRIDYIFSTAGAQVKDVVVDTQKWGPDGRKVWPSDHFPLFARLLWVTPPGSQCSPVLGAGVRGEGTCAT